MSTQEFREMPSMDNSPANGSYSSVITSDSFEQLSEIIKAFPEQEIAFITGSYGVVCESRQVAHQILHLLGYADWLKDIENEVHFIYGLKSKDRVNLLDSPNAIVFSVNVNWKKD